MKTIYVGPTIDGVAITNTIYERPPDALESAIEKRPYLAGLIIPISDLASAMRQIEGKTGAIYKLYDRAQKESAQIQKGAN